MHTLPEFTLPDYARLLDDLIAADYRLLPASAIHLPPHDVALQPRVVFMRHDIDLHLRGLEPFAKIEHERNVRSTYYVMVSQYYNIIEPSNQAVLMALIAMGHEIGLHYDLATYPENVADAQKKLDWEVNFLSEVIGRRVTRIVMHRPHYGKPDLFKQSDLYEHPHDPRYQHGLTYLSDSCRAWRDEALLACFGDAPPARVMFNTHPEHWLAQTPIRSRFDYLDQMTIPASTAIAREYAESERTVWRTHPAALAHDRRARQKAN